MAHDLIRPALLAELKPLARSIFHLDGPASLHHLDLLLDLPSLDAIQWVYGPGQGPAGRWLDLYHRMRAAAKRLQLIAHDADDALMVLEAIGPRGVWITVETPFASGAEADRFIRNVEHIVTKKRASSR
jgi:hypothetical protein